MIRLLRYLPWVVVPACLTLAVLLALAWVYG